MSRYWYFGDDLSKVDFDATTCEVSVKTIGGEYNGQFNGKNATKKAIQFANSIMTTAITANDTILNVYINTNIYEKEVVTEG